MTQVLEEERKETPEHATKRSITFVYAGYAVRYVYLLILVPFYAQVLGAEEYGRLLTAMSLFQIVWLATEYGFAPTGMRDVAVATSSSERGRLYGQHISARCLTGSAGLLIGVAGTWLSPILAADPRFGLLATACGVVAGFNLGWYFQGTLKFRTSVLLEVLGFALNLGLVLALVHERADGWRVMAALLVSSVACTCLAHWLVLRELSHHAVRFGGAVKLLRTATALFAHNAVAQLTASSSTYVLGFFAAPAVVGWYGAAEKLAGVGLSLLRPASQVLTGLASNRMGGAGADARIADLAIRGLRALTTLGCIMLLGAWLVSDPIVPWVLGPEFAPAVPLLKALALMFPFAAITEVLVGAVLIPRRRDGLILKASTLSATVTLGLMFALGYFFQAWGVVWARVAGGVLSAAVLLWSIRRDRYLVPLNKPVAQAP